jgi:hypothetical protein
MRYLLIFFFLSGCATVEDRRQLMLSNADKNCTQMGFKKGTTEHSNCQLDLLKAALGAPRPAIAMPVQAPSRTTTCTSLGNTTTCN